MVPEPDNSRTIAFQRRLKKFHEDPAERDRIEALAANTPVEPDLLLPETDSGVAEAAPNHARSTQKAEAGRFQQPHIGSQQDSDIHAQKVREALADVSPRHSKVDTSPWGRWREVGDMVFVRRNRTLDVNIGLIVGEDRCLIIDTRGSERQGKEVLRAVRAITALPYAIALTHGHFDHVFGVAALRDFQPDCEVWAHERCDDELRDHGRTQRAEVAGWLREVGEETAADEVESSRIVLPNRTFSTEASVDLGGREVILHHGGAGHTDHDIIVQVPDAAVTFMGDLVEQGAPPSFDHAYPSRWAETLRQLIDSLGSVIVPGHGATVDPSFVVRQMVEIAEVARLAESLPRGLEDAELEWHINRLAVGSAAGLIGVRRAQEQLEDADQFSSMRV